MNHKNLNVFKMCAYSPWRYPSNWWSNIKQFFRHFIWAWQRATRGYCDYDCFDLSEYYLNLLPVTLRHLAKYEHGYPDHYGCFENWQEAIIRMAEPLEKAREIDPIMDTAVGDLKRLEELDQKRTDLVQEGFNLIVKDFWHLWD